MGRMFASCGHEIGPEELKNEGHSIDFDGMEGIRTGVYCNKCYKKRKNEFELGLKKAKKMGIILEEKQ